MKNKYHKKKNKQNKGRTNNGMTVLLGAIKNQSKQKIQNGQRDNSGKTYS